jgi:hypothetical protein
MRQTAAYLHNQNGVIERAWRTICDGARSMLMEARLDADWWPHAVEHMCYIMNRVPCDGGPSPYERLTGKPPETTHIWQQCCNALRLPTTVATNGDTTGRQWRTPTQAGRPCTDANLRLAMLRTAHATSWYHVQVPKLSYTVTWSASTRRASLMRGTTNWSRTASISMLQSLRAG